MMGFTVTVYDEERRKDFEAVFGSATVPVLSPVPNRAELPGFDHPVLVYELDLERVSADQRQRLVAWIAEKFGMDAADVEAHLEEEGVAILASDCVASLGDIRKFL